MLCGTGWPEEQRLGFKKELVALIESIAKVPAAPKWHTWCEYDARMRRSPKARGEWRKVVSATLCTPGPGGEVQLIPDRSRVGRGVVLCYEPASNAGGFADVSEDTGSYVGRTAADRIVDLVAIKARKVRNGRRAQAFSRWWLVLDDEVVFVHGILSHEWIYVEDRVSRCDEIDQWNKVVLFSPLTGSWRPVHEKDGEPVLGIFE